MIKKGETVFDLESLGKRYTALFKERLNRFVATASIEGKDVLVHVADTGRLEEILTPGRSTLLIKNREGMKTQYTLLAAKMEEGWVLVNSRLHRPIAKKAIEKGVLGFLPERIEEEVTFGKSRFDYRVDDSFVELKGCSLVEKGYCLFPNAPTARGVKHLEELIKASENGFEAYILIMAVRPCSCFKPHSLRDELFRKTFFKALKAGVKYRGFHIRIEGSRILFDGYLELCRQS